MANLGECSILQLIGNSKAVLYESNIICALRSIGNPWGGTWRSYSEKACNTQFITSIIVTKNKLRNWQPIKVS